MKKSFWEFFIRNYKFTFIIALTALVFGFFAAVQMPKESQPEVNIPIGIVVTAFPGASVDDVEELVTNVIEDNITNLDNVSEITSVSRRGISTVTVEFNAKADTDEMIQELKDKIDDFKRELPGDAEDPIVQKVSLDDTPFLTLAVGGPFPLAQLDIYAEDISSEIERVNGVSTVQVFGGQDREIQVIVNNEKLNNFGISLGQVTQAIQSANTNIPIGSIITAEEEFALRFTGRVGSKEDVEAIPVIARDGVPVFVRDIATVIDAYSEPEKIVRLSTNGNASEPAVTLRIFKSEGGDVTKIADNILQKVEELKSEQLPEQVTVIPIENLAEYIRKDLSSLLRNGIATVVIVTLLLFFFLGAKEALLAAISIPLSFFMTFIILFYSGYSINFMTLFSLILSLGILVDSTIVINESLHKQMKTANTPIEAARKTINELQFPLIAGTLTTVFAFVPMLLTSGILGEYIKSIPVTVTAVLVSSLFVALGIITTLSVFLQTREKKKNKQKKKGKTQMYFAGLFERLRSGYKEFLKQLLVSKEKRKRFKRTLIVLFILAYALPFGGILKAELFPPADENSFGIDVKNSFGTPLEKTVEDLREVEKLLYEDERVVSAVLNGGFSGNLGSAAGGGEGTHLGYILVNLTEEGRKEKSFEIVDEYQAKFEELGLENVSVSQPSYGPGAGAPIEIRIQGDDLAILDSLAKEYEEMLKNINGTQNVDTSIVQTNGQFVFEVNRAKAANYGLSATDVAYAARNAITGVEAVELQVDGDDVDVVVRTGLQLEAFEPGTNKRKTSLATIQGLSLSSPQGEIPLSSVVNIGLENSRANIEHTKGERIVKVVSNIRSDVSAGQIFKEVEKGIENIEIPDGYQVSTGGQDEDTAQSLNDMFKAMILAVVLIASLLVLQFKSFRQSFIVLTTIPFALIGVFPGLVLVGLPLSFPGMIGIVALAGIVVNNAIILIDKINRNREDEGMNVHNAIIEAGSSRLEPIILTTITTVSGILPLAISEPIWSSLGFSIIFGLLFSTVQTLIVVPLLYRRLYRKEIEV